MSLMCDLKCLKNRVLKTFLWMFQGIASKKYELAQSYATPQEPASETDSQESLRCT